jgi:hypothetical protein
VALHRRAERGQVAFHGEHVLAAAADGEGRHNGVAPYQSGTACPFTRRLITAPVAGSQVSVPPAPMTVRGRA